jgi:ubiquinone/menaquinone biosynthesis C-methylase UbiE
MMLKRYFDTAAHRYALDIEPVYRALARHLVSYSSAAPHETVIDLGTGSGLVAREVAGHCRMVVAVDFSTKMLKIARRTDAALVMQSDLHALAVGSQTFDLALAGFAFNATDPALSFGEVFRILKPGGRLIMHEWETLDTLSKLAADTLAEYAVESPPPDLAALREMLGNPIPWDDLEDKTDLESLLYQTGFAAVETENLSIPVSFDSVEAFIRYKTAWPSRQAELAAMPEEIRRLCLSDLAENLSVHTRQDGSLIWHPGIIRAKAYKPD